MSAFDNRSQAAAQEIDTTTKKDRLSKRLTAREINDIDLVFKEFDLPDTQQDFYFDNLIR